MKKILVVVVVVVAALLAAVMLLKPAPAPGGAAMLVPGDAVLFVDFPDLPETSARWQHSPIGKMLVDPKLQPFWQKPLRELLNLSESQATSSILKNLKLLKIFIVASWPDPGAAPQILIGFQSAAGDAEAKAALDRLHEELAANGGGGPREWKHEAANGMQQTMEGGTLYTITAEGWGAVANSPEALSDFLDRAAGKNRETSLASQPSFVKSVEALGFHKPDGLVFASPAKLMAPLRDLAESEGATPIAEQFAQIEKLESLAIGVQFTPTGVNEKAVAWSVEGGAPFTDSQVAAFGARFAPADALFLTSLVWEPGKAMAAALPSLPPELIQLLTAAGIETGEIAASLGNRMSYSMWWPPGSLIPAALGVVEIQDADAFGKIASQLGALIAGEATSAPVGNLQAITIKADALGLINPTVAYGEEFVFIALNPGDIARGLETGSSSNNLAASQIWKDSSTFLAKADLQASLVDVPGILRRAYATFQPMLGFAAAMSPQVNRYADLSKLPEVDALTSHLGPVVSRKQALDGGGILSEISGPVTWSSLFFAIPAGLTDGFSFLEEVATEK